MLTPSPQPKPTKTRRVPCDPRCTSARGPDCECKCQGAHHGEDWRDTRTADLFTTEGNENARL